LPAQVIAPGAIKKEIHMPFSSAIIDNAKRSTRTSSSIIAPVLTAALGAVLLYLAGFAQIEDLHNSAHDTRHASGFPCH